MSNRLPISRRDFLASAGIAGAVAVIIPATAPARIAANASGKAPVAPAAASAAPEPVISFHQDAPYLDDSGQGIPYRPPPGMRAADALARLTEAEFHSLGIV